MISLISYFGVVLIIVLYIYLKRKNNYWKTRNVPHKKPTVLFGHFLDLLLDRQFPGKYFRDLYDDFDAPYIGFLSFLEPVLLIKDLDIIKSILIKDFNVFTDRMAVADEKIDPFLANGLLGIKGDKWKGLRNKLSPVFTSGKVKLMTILMKECGEKMVQYVTHKTGESLEVKEVVAKFTTDVISTCAFGINANSFESEESEFRKAGKKMFSPSFLQSLKALSYFMIPKFVQLFKLTFIDPNAAIFLREAFNKTIRKREESNLKRNDLIDILIELKNQDNDEADFKFYGDRLVAQAIIFFGAGQETTSSVIAFTVHELCINTDIQDRLRDEIEFCIRKHNELTYDAIQDMKYLHMVVSEVLRKYPIIPFLMRVSSEDYIISKTGLKLEKNTIVLITPYGMHWNPEYFPNPQIFDPERFNVENKKNIKPYTYLPFGDGPRNCIGERFGLLSSKLGLIYLLRNFKINRNSLTQDSLSFSPAGLANVIGGIQVTFTKI